MLPGLYPTGKPLELDVSYKVKAGTKYNTKHADNMMCKVT